MRWTAAGIFMKKAAIMGVIPKRRIMLAHITMVRLTFMIPLLSKMKYCYDSSLQLYSIKHECSLQPKNVNKIWIWM
jgi:hypothetical protein